MRVEMRTCTFGDLSRYGMLNGVLDCVISVCGMCTLDEASVEWSALDCLVTVPGK